MPEIQIQEGFDHDCTKCQGLCCVAQDIKKESGFPSDKPAGVVCDKLSVDPAAQSHAYKCQVFATLGEEGRTLCEKFSCLGAGNAISQFFYELGISWALKPENIDDEKWQLIVHNMHEAYIVLFNVFVQLHAIQNINDPRAQLWYEAVRGVVQNVAKDFAAEIESNSSAINGLAWYRNRFLYVMKLAMDHASSLALMNKLGGKEGDSVINNK